MRLMQDEQPIEHHLIWRNSAFHRHEHETVYKRKMLGGVSFDGGAALENNKSRGSTTQAGVQEAQPPLTDKYNENLSLSEMGLGLGRRKGTADTASQKENDGKADAASQKEGSVKAVKHTAADNKATAVIKDEASINENAAVHNIFMAADNFFDKIVTHVTELDNFKISSSSLVRRLTHKLGKGIHTLLAGSGQDGNKQSEQRSKKKLSNGTRAVTKEDVYEIQINSSYLLESYNKNGERSTLGK